MKIEILYPEVCYLFGDLMNVEYLRRCIPEAEVIRTSLKTPPAFLYGDVDMVYLCSMTERAQELVINALRPYKAQSKPLSKAARFFLPPATRWRFSSRILKTRTEAKSRLSDFLT